MHGRRVADRGDQLRALVLLPTLARIDECPASPFCSEWWPVKMPTILLVPGIARAWRIVVGNQELLP